MHKEEIKLHASKQQDEEEEDDDFYVQSPSTTPIYEQTHTTFKTTIHNEENNESK